MSTGEVKTTGHANTAFVGAQHAAPDATRNEGTPSSPPKSVDHLVKNDAATAPTIPGGTPRATATAPETTIAPSPSGAAHQASDTSPDGLRRELTGIAIAAQLTDAQQLADKLVRDNRLSGIFVPYGGVRRTINQARERHDLTADEAKLAIANVDLAEARTWAASAHAASTRFVETRAQLRANAEAPVFDEFGITQTQNAQALADFDTTRDAAIAAVRRDATTAIARMQSVRDARPTDAARIDADIAAFNAHTDRQIADMYLATGDHAGAARALLPPSLDVGRECGGRDNGATSTTTGCDPLAPDVRYNVDTEGRGRGIIGSLFTHTTRVGRLTPEHRDATARAIAALPEADRKRAIDGLMQLTDMYSHADDVGRANTSREILGAVARLTGDEPLAIRSSELHAQHLTRTDNFDGARKELDAAYARADKLPESADTTGVRAELVAGMVAVDRAQASLGTDPEHLAAADRLHALRERFEKSGPLSREQLARFALLEAQTMMGQHRPVDAGRALDALERYSDMPWAAEAAKAYRRDHTEAGITAALKVGLRAANSGSLGVTLGATFGTGAVGAGVGFLIAGPPGAGVGFLIGSAIGNAGSATYAVARRWDEVTQAFDTGMTSLTAGNAITDGAFLGLNFVASAAPVAGVARVATAGLTRVGVTSLGTVAERQIVAQAIARESLAFGGKPLAIAGAGAITAPIGVDFARIQSITDPQERQREMERFQANLGKTAVVAGATITANVIGAKLALRGPRVPASHINPLEHTSSPEILTHGTAHAETIPTPLRTIADLDNPRLSKLVRDFDQAGFWRDANGNLRLGKTLSTNDLHALMRSKDFEEAVGDHKRLQRRIQTMPDQKLKESLAQREAFIGDVLNTIAERRVAVADEIVRRQNAGQDLAYPNGMGLQDIRSKTVMLEPNQRAPYAVTIDANGRLLQNGAPISSIGHAARDGMTDDRVMFVLSENGTLYVDQEMGRDGFHHSSLVGGRDVLAAGEMKIVDGVVKEVNDQSGHYELPPIGSRQLAHFFLRNNVPLADVQFVGQAYNNVPFPMIDLLGAEPPPIRSWARTPWAAKPN